MKKLSILSLLLVCGFGLTACGDSKQTEVKESVDNTEQVNKDDKTDNKAKEEEGDFVKTAADAYFDGTMLKGNTYSIKITDYKIIPVGEKGNEYGDTPVIAFWYDTLVSPDYDNSEPVDPSTAWIMNFTAIQDNDPNMVNELNVAGLPDDQYLDSQIAEIKPGGTVSSAVAYELSDEETPVTLKAGSMLGQDFGQYDFKIK